MSHELSEEAKGDIARALANIDSLPLDDQTKEQLKVDVAETIAQTDREWAEHVRRLADGQ